MSHGVEGRTGAGAIDTDIAAAVAEAMGALAAPSRVLILGCLREEARSVGALAEAVGMEQSAVSHQLRILRHLGLVIGHRRGRQVIYALHDEHVATLLEQAVFHAEHRRLGAVSPLLREDSA